VIVKCQRPLVTNDPVPKVLIYNKTRSVEHLTPYTREWRSWFGKALKRYARAHLEGTIIVIDNIVEDRNW